MRVLQLSGTCFSLASEDDQQKAALSWAGVTSMKGLPGHRREACVCLLACASAPAPLKSAFSWSLGWSTAFRTSSCEMTPSRTSLAIASLAITHAITLLKPAFLQRAPGTLWCVDHSQSPSFFSPACPPFSHNYLKSMTLNSYTVSTQTRLTSLRCLAPFIFLTARSEEVNFPQEFTIKYFVFQLSF